MIKKVSVLPVPFFVAQLFLGLIQIQADCFDKSEIGRCFLAIRKQRMEGIGILPISSLHRKGDAPFHRRNLSTVDIGDVFINIFGESRECVLVLPFVIKSLLQIGISF